MKNSKRRVAVVTGAGSGIGAEVSRLLYKKGHNIALIGKSEKNVKKVSSEIDKTQDNVCYFACDVANEGSLIEVRQKIIKKWSKIDILITCAAAPGFSEKMEKTSFNDWRSVMAHSGYTGDYRFTDSKTLNLKTKD